jgi:GTPase SAR1 family protein
MTVAWLRSEASNSDKAPRSIKEECRSQILPRFAENAMGKARRLKAVAIGDGATGKTSLLIRYTTNTCPLDVSVTVRSRLVVHCFFTSFSRR